jgi:hypothetical protein
MLQQQHTRQEGKEPGTKGKEKGKKERFRQLNKQQGENTYGAHYLAVHEKKTKEPNQAKFFSLFSSTRCENINLNACTKQLFIRE